MPYYLVFSSYPWDDNIDPDVVKADSPQDAKDIVLDTYTGRSTNLHVSVVGELDMSQESNGIIKLK